MRRSLILSEYRPRIFFTCVFVVVIFHWILLYALMIQKVIEPPRILKVRNIGEKNGEHHNVQLNPISSPWQSAHAPDEMLNKGSRSENNFQPVRRQNKKLSKKNKQGIGQATQAIESQPSEAFQYQVKGIHLSKVLKNFTPAQLSQLTQSDLSINLKVPKGVKEDELNKIEQIFYTFRKRVFIQYVNTLLKNLEEHQYTHPHLPFPMTKNSQKLTVKATFDERGNLLRLKTVEWSNVPELQDFYMKALQDIISVPNPPQAFIRDQKEFDIFYSLIIK